VKYLDDTIDRAQHRNLILLKFIRFDLHEDNPNISFPDKDQKLLDKLKVPDFMEKGKSKSSTPPPNPSDSAMNYKKPDVEIPPINID
jgi:hypothetical protein